jgi:hypothetical protein
MAKARWKSTQILLQAAFNILRRENPMTVRQLFYRLVSVAVIENCIADYRRVSAIMTEGREQNEIPWEWIVDRSRPSYSSASWAGLEEYGEVVARSYRKDYWQNQSRHVVVLVEKDAIVGSIQPVTEKYGVTIRTLRGFSSATVAHGIAAQFRELNKAGKQIHVFYLGDHDPSGRAIELDVAKRIEEFMAVDLGKGVQVTFREMRRAVIVSRMPKDLYEEIWNGGEVERRGDESIEQALFRISCRHLGLDRKTACLPFVLRRLAIHPEDIQKFNLPPLRIKAADPRAAGFLREHGTECVELDALPPSELRARLSRAIRGLIDRPAWERAMMVEKAELETTRRVADAFRGLAPAGSLASL